MQRALTGCCRLHCSLFLVTRLCEFYSPTNTSLSWGDAGAVFLTITLTLSLSIAVA